MRRCHVESCFPCLAHTFHAKSSPLLGYHVDVYGLLVKLIYVLQYTLDVLGYIRLKEAQLLPQLVTFNPN